MSRRPVRFRMPCLVLTLALLGSGAVHADARPVLDQAADAVAAAHAKGDAAALARRAVSTNPDPWIVLEELCRRRAHEVAAAFAEAAPESERPARRAYAMRRKTSADIRDRRKQISAANAARRRGDAKQVLVVTADVPDRPTTVNEIQLLRLRALGFELEKRLGEAARVDLRAAQAARTIGWQAAALELFHLAGLRAYRFADWPLAVQAWEARIEVAERTGNRKEAAVSIGNVAIVFTRSDQTRKALAAYGRALKIHEGMKDELGKARVLHNMGHLYSRNGNFARARSHHERARAAMIKLGNKPGIAVTTGSLGGIYSSLGEYPKALELLEASLELQRALGNKRGVSAMLSGIGTIHQHVGDFESAMEFHRKALALRKEVGDRAGLATGWMNLGAALFHVGRYKESLAWQERAGALFAELGDQRGRVGTLENAALAHRLLGDYAKALEIQQRVVAFQREQKNTFGLAKALGNIGQTYLDLGDPRVGLTHLEDALRHAKRLRARQVTATWLPAIAKAHLDLGENEQALLRAQQALDAVEGLLGGLGEESAATARARHAKVFEVGMLAAIRLGNMDELITFVESGRAGAMLESLDAGRAVRFSDVPEALLDARAEANRRVRTAQANYARAVEGGKRRETRARGEELNAAVKAERQLAERIQREAKRAAGLFYPTTATLSELQGRLGPTEALLHYAFCLDETYAILVTTDAARYVNLGPAATIRQACGQARITSAASDVAVLPTLRRLLVEPLKLDKRIESVLVSPGGALGYVPFGALFDRRVVCTPSGTTHLLLLEDAGTSGKGILAIGDPDYAGTSGGAQAIYFRGRKLQRLPATRDEAKSVGTEHLLGADATESALASKLRTQDRWRAVHFACHGLIDPERPIVSSLALTADKHSDGFLTLYEVLDLDIRANLVVLSACETATGKIYRGEGIVGLTRIFMYAGAPRVICSLWKVDDKATQALMTKFYELWNATPAGEKTARSAAEALRQAQAHVRAQEKWRHPYYWAAWVLWGLPS